MRRPLSDTFPDGKFNTHVFHRPTITPWRIADRRRRADRDGSSPHRLFHSARRHRHAMGHFAGAGFDALMLMAALVIARPATPQWLVTTYEVLILLDIAGTSLCAYFLELYALLVLMAVALLGWALHISARGTYILWRHDHEPAGRIADDGSGRAHYLCRRARRVGTVSGSGGARANSAMERLQRRPDGAKNIPRPPRSRRKMSAS